MRLIIYKYVELANKEFVARVYLDGVYKEQECLKLIKDAKNKLGDIYAGSIQIKFYE